jgi:hypothetical protein
LHPLEKRRLYTAHENSGHAGRPLETALLTRFGRRAPMDAINDLDLEELRNSLEALDNGRMVDLALDDDWLNNCGR